MARKQDNSSLLTTNVVSNGISNSQRHICAYRGRRSNPSLLTHLSRLVNWRAAFPGSSDNSEKLQDDQTMRAVCDRMNSSSSTPRATLRARFTRASLRRGEVIIKGPFVISGGFTKTDLRGKHVSIASLSDEHRRTVVVAASRNPIP